MDKLYDFECLLKWNGGDEEISKELAAIFVEVIPETRDALADAARKKDWDRIFKSAHKMKASIDMFGIHSLEQLIRKIETEGRHKIESESLAADVKHVTETIDACISQLKKDFSITV